MQRINMENGVENLPGSEIAKRISVAEFGRREV